MAADDAPTSDRPDVEHIPKTDRIVRWLTEGQQPGLGGRIQSSGKAAALGSTQVELSPEDIHEYRPSLRPPVPVLTVLDDGSTDHGEDFRLRKDVCVIGRSSGDVQIPNDPWISGLHAEIRRQAWKGGFQWHLHDCESANGTFVRCVRAMLHDNAVVILGARRFRLRNPLKGAVAADAGGETRHIDRWQVPETVWPVLHEVTTAGEGLQFPLRSETLSVGRLGGRADIELDDPLLANQHAMLLRQKDGTWLIKAAATRNGVWVSISTVGLTASCLFRCGEQRFRFVIP
jgi:pSer/pThr/pTyr-binding forkhead associated (FHA) protein